MKEKHAKKKEQKRERVKLLFIVRNEDHCEHNAIERRENQQFDNKLKEEKQTNKTQSANTCS